MSLGHSSPPDLSCRFMVINRRHTKSKHKNDSLMVSNHFTFHLKRKKFLQVECSARATIIGPFFSLTSLGFELRTPPKHISCKAPGSLAPVTGYLIAWLGWLSQACLERQQVDRQAEDCSPGSLPKIQRSCFLSQCVV